MEERIVAADPVADPEGYKQELLALLGGDDPLEVLAQTPRIWRARVANVRDEALHTRPEPNEWSVEELLGHFFGAEIVYSFRWRVVLAQDNPTLIGYDQDAWTSLARPPFAEMLNAFEALRTANLRLLQNTPRSDWERAGRHLERGPESVALGVGLIAGHDRAHLKQLDQTLAAVTGA